MSKGNEESNQRPLVTADELRRHSGQNIFTFINNLHPTFFAKLPYYVMQELTGKYDENPYIVV